MRKEKTPSPSPDVERTEKKPDSDKTKRITPSKETEIQKSLLSLASRFFAFLLEIFTFIICFIEIRILDTNLC